MNPVTLFCLSVECSAHALKNIARMSNNSRDTALSFQRAVDQLISGLVPAMPAQLKFMLKEAVINPDAFVQPWPEDATEVINPKSLPKVKYSKRSK